MLRFKNEYKEMLGMYDPFQVGERGKEHILKDNEAIVGAYGVKDASTHITSFGFILAQFK